jgi:hypothetical protein
MITIKVDDTPPYTYDDKWRGDNADEREALADLLNAIDYHVDAPSIVRIPVLIGNARSVLYLNMALHKTITIQGVPDRAATTVQPDGAVVSPAGFHSGSVSPR